MTRPRVWWGNIGIGMRTGQEAFIFPIAPILSLGPIRCSGYQRWRAGCESFQFLLPTSKVRTAWMFTSIASYNFTSHKHSPTYAVSKLTQFFYKSKKNWNNRVFETRVEFCFADMKARWDEGGGRILLGDSTGGGAAKLWFGGISASLQWIYTYGWSYVHSIPPWTKCGLHRAFWKLTQLSLLFRISIHQIYEIISVPIPKISERGNHKWCNLWRSSRINILGYANQ